MAVRYFKIKLSKLVLWDDNPRIAQVDGETDSTSSIIAKLYAKSNNHFKNLANDIAKRGLIPNDLPVVIFNKDHDNFSVYEGNRRIGIMKAMYNPSLVNFDDQLSSIFNRLKKNLNKELVPFKVNCCVVDSIEEAFQYVERLHAGEDSGRGRVTWGHLEKQAFRTLKNDLTNSDKKTSPVYTLVTNYPAFSELIDEMLPSNANRLLVSSDLKNSIQIKSYDNLNPLQIELLLRTLKEAQKLSIEYKLPISRLFRTVNDTRGRLLPFIENEKIHLLEDEKYKLIKPNVVIPDIKIKQDQIVNKTTNSLSLLPFVVNYESFTKIDITVINLDNNTLVPINDYILPAGLLQGRYQIKYDGYINELVASTKSIELIIEPFVKIERAIKKRFSLLDTSGYKIKISEPIGQMIEEINSLSIDKYPMVIKGSLRYLIEESLKVVFNNQGWTFTEKSLENKLDDFKAKCSHKDVLTLINNNTSMGYDAIKNFINNIDSSKTASKLNAITHTPDSIPSDEIIELSKTTIARLLVIFTGLCRK